MRPNAFAGPCKTCGKTVAPMEGQVSGMAGRRRGPKQWSLVHNDCIVKVSPAGMGRPWLEGLEYDL